MREGLRTLLLAIQVVAGFLVSVAMALAWAHALELPGKMRLNKEQYLATQAIYYPGFTIGGGAEPLAMLATLWLLLLTPANSPAFWWTLTSLLAIAAMHAVFWTVTQPVNKFWVSDLKPKGASAAFFGPVEPKATIGEGYEVQWQALRNQWGIFSSRPRDPIGNQPHLACHRRRPSRQGVGAWFCLR